MQNVDTAQGQGTGKPKNAGQNEARETRLGYASFKNGKLKFKGPSHGHP